MVIAPDSVPWWAWAVGSAGSWIMRAIVKRKSSEDGSDFATVASFVLAVAAGIAAVLAIVVYYRWAAASSSMWLLQAAFTARMG